MGPASGRKWGPIHANGLVGHPIDWCSSVVRNHIPSNNLAMIRGKGPVAVLMLQTSWSCWIGSTALVTFWKAVRPPTTAILQAVGKPLTLVGIPTLLLSSRMCATWAARPTLSFLFSKSWSSCFSRVPTWTPTNGTLRAAFNACKITPQILDQLSK